jgi:hypothetical protein
MLFCCVVEMPAVTDGVCDDVLDGVEGNADETVIKLMQEEEGIRGKIWFRQENLYLRWNQEDVTHWKIRCTERALPVGTHRRYVLHKEMCI